MDDGSSFQVRLGLSQDLVRDRSGIPLPEEDVAEHVRKRVALRPAQVAVGRLASFVTQVQEKGGYGVGHHRALPPQYSVTSHVHASQLKHLLLELRGVFHVDLQKQDRHILRDVVVLSLLLQLPCILFGVVGKAAAVGDDVDLIPLAGLFYEPLGLLVYLYSCECLRLIGQDTTCTSTSPTSRTKQFMTFPRKNSSRRLRWEWPRI